MESWESVEDLQQTEGECGGYDELLAPAHLQIPDYAGRKED